ncbi:uncharacterized protein K452DRAFT_283005 [Aplosporella prunicola CBS 121167]|uniref:NmrA-like domain-containing protein n=1 Tax=Aplosporella prunicola CBS 121167 TaxID=1176127 RepID=A0A6A6BTV4_9PEZI|nr:uncharacterized protein K452DRAFT_283005 [Aplosporella prunicola CBS 121167]KAF2146803.1 hypothetical protein K452DRAFT_283005 [Aplosporella prunicola CBS 121167]
MPQLAITGASGKLGGAVLHNLLKYNLLPPNELVVSTSSSADDPLWAPIKEKGVIVRQASYDDSESMEKAFAGCKCVLIVSTPRIEMDFDDAPYGKGREAHHFAAIRAARAANVRHIYYTSLGFGQNSKSGVMVAHNRTEEFLQMLSDTHFTIIREGLYNESWPLYLGHYDATNEDGRQEVLVAGDGPISWAAIDDLGLATASIITDEQSSCSSGVTITLASTGTHTLEDIAAMVSRAKSRNIALKVVSREEHEQYYKERGMDPRYVTWWAKTYAALKENECENQDRTFERLLAKYERTPKSLEQTINEMVGSKR